MAHLLRVSLTSFGTLVALSTLAGDALATKGGGCKGKRDFGFAEAEAYVGVLHVPSLAINGDDTPRRLVGVATPALTEPLLGAGVGLAFRCDYLVFDIVSLRYATGADSGVAGTAAANDGVANISRGAMQTLSIGIPTFGLPSGFQLFPTDESKVTLSFEVGFEHIWAGGVVSGAGVSPSLGAIDSWDFYGRTALAACLRVGPRGREVLNGWACLDVSALLYDRAPFPGISLGVRLEL